MKEIASLMILVLLCACADAGTKPGDSSGKFDGEWQLVSGRGPKGDVPAAPEEITLSIESGRRIHG